ncbi:uncharacterized protein LY89DRAFT_714378 [Mollisia scopiformis]|uniref:BTB domain-containing protein n=1 Tax=Mollisia scopiformis TaxID=149040 RepID=A0A194XQR6_MOLSC|nr:uncharacterized protein LY89DRAFT_714378 [Mollisia scopiformis]KUJ22620.1 hypothetical protein LY89DRAFT_714378 [Mollisia scopiformis]
MSSAPNRPTESFSRPSARENRNKPRDIPEIKNPSDLATFVVGRVKKHFQIHKDVLYHHSPTSRAALNSPFNDKQSQTCQLPDVTERAFKHLFDWLYFQDIKIHQLEDEFYSDWTQEGKKNTTFEENMALAESWLLGEKFGFIEFQNLVLTKIHNITNKCHTFPSELLQYAFEHTGPENQLRKYMVALCSMGISPDYLSVHGEKFPPEFFQEMAVFMARFRDKVEDGSYHWNEDLKVKVSDYFVRTDVVVRSQIIDVDSIRRIPRMSRGSFDEERD